MMMFQSVIVYQTSKNQQIMAQLNPNLPELWVQPDPTKNLR